MSEIDDAHIVWEIERDCLIKRLQIVLEVEDAQPIKETLIDAIEFIKGSKM